MKIGLDFDGVLSNYGKLKQYGIRLKLGLDVPLEKTDKKILISEGILTKEQYLEICGYVLGSEELIPKMEPVQGALEFCRKLIKDGHDMVIVTSRGKGETIVAQKWLKMYDLNIPIIGVGIDNSKKNACTGLDVYLDDDIDKIENVGDVVSHKFLMSWPYNLHINPPSAIKRVSSWRNFYEEVSALKN